MSEVPSSRGETGASRRLLWPALLLLALLAVVGVATHGGGSSSAEQPRRTPSNGFLSYAISTYLVVALAMVVLVVLLVVTQRRELPARSGTRDLRSLILLVVVAALIALVASLKHVHPRGHPATFRSPPQVGAPAGKAGRNARDTPPLGFKWAPAVALAALVAAGFAAALIARRRRPGFRTPLSLAEEVGQVLDLALDDLRSERDPRRAIISAYARMERLLGAHGFPRRPAETPFEYLARVLVELQASPAPVFDLTTLFERAKFSHHDIGPELKDEAIDALASVRDELRAAA